jgi:hypothetical protein
MSMSPANLPGTALNKPDYETLKRCFISRDLADRACLRRVSHPEGRDLVAANGRAGDYSGIAIPYISVRDGNVREYRLRRDHPELTLQIREALTQAGWGGKAGERGRGGA